MNLSAIERRIAKREQLRAPVRAESMSDIDLASKIAQIIAGVRYRVLNNMRVSKSDERMAAGLSSIVERARLRKEIAE